MIMVPYQLYSQASTLHLPSEFAGRLCRPFEFLWSVHESNDQGNLLLFQLKKVVILLVNKVYNFIINYSFIGNVDWRIFDGFCNKV